MGCTGRFCAGRALRRPGVAAAPGGAHGQMHLPAGKVPARPLARHPAGRAAGRCRDGILPAGGHLSGHEPCVSGGGKAQPMAGPCRTDVLVRAGAGCKGPCAGELPGVCPAEKGRPARRPQGREPHRGPRHPEPDRRGRDKGRGGNGGRKCQRRRHCAAAVYAHRRGTAGADLQGYQYHGQHAGLQKREVSLLWPRSREAGRCGQLHPQPHCRPFVGGRCGLYRQRCQGRMAHLAAGPAQPRQPQQRPDRKRLRRCTGRAAGRPGLLFWRILPQAYHR